MAIEKVRNYFRQLGMEDHIIEFEESTATVQQAADALGTEPGQIAKTMSLRLADGAVLIVTAGDARIDNHKFKEQFHTKPTMVPWDDVEALVGHAPGGVCPFAAKEDVPVYLDVSLKKYKIVYPAAGNAHSAIKLTIPELEKTSGYREWIDVCKDPKPAV